MGRDLHVHSHPSGIEHWRHLIEIAALVTAAIWAFYVFIYQERIKPANEHPRLQSQLLVHHENLSAQKEYVEVELNLKNLSGADASLDGMIVNVYGRSMTTKSAEHVESPMNGITELNRTLTLSPPKLLYSFYDTWRAFGSPATKGWGVIRAGQDFRERLAFGIVPGSVNILKITYAFCYSRPGSAAWPVHREQRPDGSYYFAGIDLRAPGLVCFGQRRGEYFPA